MCQLQMRINPRSLELDDLQQCLMGQVHVLGLPQPEMQERQLIIGFVIFRVELDDFLICGQRFTKLLLLATGLEPP